MYTITDVEELGRDSWIVLMHSARHVIGCHLNQEVRIQSLFDDRD